MIVGSYDLPRKNKKVVDIMRNVCYTSIVVGERQK